MCLKFPLSPYTMLWTHNIVWRNFCSLFLNIVKKGKRRETQNCPNSSFSHSFCHWLPGKSTKFPVCYFTVAHFKSNWKHAFNNYVTIIPVSIFFRTQISSSNTWANKATSLFFRFYQVKPNYEYHKKDSPRPVIVH